MRRSGLSGVWHGAALGLAATLAVTALIVLPPAMPSARAQQVRQQNLNPEDVLAPSQMAQPMPAPVSEPRAAPKKKAAGKARRGRQTRCRQTWDSQA